MRHFILALALVGCGSRPAITATPQPASTPVAAPIPAPLLVFGEVTAFDQHGEPVLKLHADGSIDQRTSGEWAPHVVLARDGTVSLGGKQVERLAPARLRDLEIRLDGNEVRGRTADGDLAFVLWDDGRVKATLRDSGTELRVEGAEPAARRTLFLWLSVVAIVNYRNGTLSNGGSFRSIST
jgi:hypothetical protein